MAEFERRDATYQDVAGVTVKKVTLSYQGWHVVTLRQERGQAVRIWWAPPNSPAFAPETPRLAVVVRDAITQILEIAKEMEQNND